MGKKIFFIFLVIILAGGAFWLSKKDDSRLLRQKLGLGKKMETGTQKIYKIGVVMTGGAYQQALDGLKKGLSERGLYEGQNVIFMIRDTRGSTEALKSATEGLVAEKPDIIYSISTPVTTQVQKIAGDQMPVVFNIVGDPIGAGFAKSYSAPGTNLTGCSNLSAELSGKRLEIFKEAFPNIKKVVTFYTPDNKFSQISIENAREAAKILGIEIQEIIIKDKEELEKSLANIQTGDYDGIFITPDAMVISNVDLVIKRSLEIKTPTMGHEQTLAEKGATLTYGANFYNMGIQCSSIAANVLFGQEPKITPILTPDKLDIVVNQKNLENIGLSIADKMPKEADKIIR